MKDPQFQLRKAYKTALDDLSVGTFTIPFHHLAIRPSRRPYIYIRSISVAGVPRTKTGFASTLTIDLGIKQIYRNDKDGYKLVDDISDEVIKKLIVRPGSYLTLTGFEMITANLLNTDTTISQLRSGQEVERIITIEHIITED